MNSVRNGPGDKKWESRTSKGYDEEYFEKRSCPRGSVGTVQKYGHEGIKMLAPTVI